MIYISINWGNHISIVLENIKKEVDFFFQKRLLKESPAYRQAGICFYPARSPSRRRAKSSSLPVATASGHLTNSMA